MLTQATNRYRLRGLAESVIIHDYATAELDRVFDCSRKRGLFLVRLPEHRVKVKKLDANWQPRNIPTQTFLRFMEQAQLDLFDNLWLTNIILGYQKDPIDPSRSTVWLVCPDGADGLRWVAELTEHVASPPAAAPKPQPEAAPAKRIRAKKPVRKDDGGKKAGEGSE